MNDERIAFISGKEMGLVQGGVSRRLPSVRIAQYEQNARELEKKYEWRSQGAGAAFTHQRNPFQGASMDTGAVTAVAAHHGELVYAATFPEIGGLYYKDIRGSDGPEPLILSERGIGIFDMHAHEDQMALSLAGIRQQRHIALLSMKSSGYQEITEGDAMDVAPRFSADGRRLHYASAGYGRNEQGLIIDVAPMCAMELDLSSGALIEKYADPGFDFMRPKQAPDGTLHVIRRPYRSRRVKRGPTLKDQVSIVSSVLRGFGALARMFAGKPPKDPGSSGMSSAATAKNPDEEMMIDGVALKIEQIRQQNQKRGEKYPGIAPADWVLMREENGALTPVLQGVIDYDFTPDGGIVYTNGRHILKRAPSGEDVLLVEDKLITRVAVL